ncbi:hypothetical protein H4219_000740 [Mycoemilia scoparia]|uniref:Tubulin-specific chaperone D n=1 Tax=Mycoemilia scoparia TaxID=417184 RepID=A0A9W8A2B9_9FUNG|nr:hypothetical protein H4219_000740 [Mycoemilia scoparia]
MQAEQDLVTTNRQVSFFKEKKWFEKALTELVSLAQDQSKWKTERSPSKSEWSREKELEKVLNQYQEMPNCLESSIEFIMTTVVQETIKPYILAWEDGIEAGLRVGDSRGESSGHSHKSTISTNRMDHLFRLLYVLSKVKGYKHLIKLFSNQVSDVEPVLHFLEACLEEKADKQWETRFIVYLWLTLLVMTPFDLRSIDSRASANTSLIGKWKTAGQISLKASGKEMEGAALMLSRLLTRKDTLPTELPKFLDWCFETLDSVVSSDESYSIQDIFVINGILRTICNVYRVGDRILLNPTLESTFSRLMALNENAVFQKILEENVLARKLMVKVSQRIALCYLRPTVASWRYHVGVRSLAIGLGQDKESQGSIKNDSSKFNAEESDDDFVPEEVEHLLNIIFEGLKDTDTIVRWSAAKGIGRITFRLPRQFGLEVIQMVVDQLAENTIPRHSADTTPNLFPQVEPLDLAMTSEYTWHGVCLALAELARRGLLLVEILDSIMPWILRALTYEVQRGSHSVGSNVRDAACYVAWSFARAYDFSKELFQSWVLPLATTLVSVAVFDREIHVRRAASAAFQEHVGRHGAFPHGISVLKLTDFYSVGIMGKAYISVSSKVAKFDEYKRPLVIHVATNTLYHWHIKTRELAAESLKELSLAVPEIFLTTLIPEMIRNTRSPLLPMRHGALCGLSYVVPALFNAKFVGSEDFEAHKDLVTKILQVPEQIPKQYFADFNSKFTLIALSQYIEKTILSAIVVESHYIGEYWSYIFMMLDRKEEEVHQAACNVIATIVSLYPINAADVIKRVIDGCNPQKPESTRRGSLLALGYLAATKEDQISSELIMMLQDTILNVFIDDEVASTTTVEMRQNAAETLGVFFKYLNSQKSDLLPPSWTAKTIELLKIATNDYTLDHRGDVGSLVRMGSLRSLLSIAPLLLPKISGDQADDVLGVALSQAAERIEKLRKAAGEVVHYILHEFEGITYTNIKLAARILVKEKSSNPGTWQDHDLAFEFLAPILEFRVYRKYMLSNWIVTAGGMTESLSKAAGGQLADFISALQPEMSSGRALSPPGLLFSVDDWVCRFDALSDIVDTFAFYLGNDRIILPLLSTTDLLLEWGLFEDSEIPINLWKRLCQRIQRVAFKSTDVKKLSLCIKLYTNLSLVVPDLLPMVLKPMVGYLSHSMSRVRQSAADQIFMALSMSELLDVSNVEDGGNSIDALLTTTDWAASTKVNQGARQQLIALIKNHMGGCF